MNFVVDPQKKAKIQKLIIKNKSMLRILHLIATLVFWLGIIGTVLYISLNMAIPDWGMVNVNGILKKDTFDIFFTASYFVILGSVIYLLLRVLLGNLSGKDAGGRVDEELFLENDILKYTFRIRYQFAASHRNIIIIPFKDVTSANYDPKTNAIQFYGRFSSDAADDYFSGKTITPESGNLREFILYDYFKPELIETLRVQGILK